VTRSLLPLVLALLALFGCQPEIGDECLLHSDCGGASRLCDTSFSGSGYCTQFNCEPGGCPEEAVCVAYEGSPSSLSQCEDPQGGERLQRTFCMRTCDDDGDCRTEDGFKCLRVGSADSWSATIVEHGESNAKICALPYEGAMSLPLPSEGDNVCGPLPPLDFPDAIAPSSPDGSLSDASRPDAALGDATVVDGAPGDSAPGDSAPQVDASVDSPSGDAGAAPTDAQPSDAPGAG
jgi:hypothetical protein